MKRNMHFIACLATVAGVTIAGCASAQSPLTSTAPIVSDANNLSAYAGTYKLPPFDVVVTAEEGKLFAEPSGQPKLELARLANDSFSVPAVEAEMTFSRNAAGAVTSMTLQHGGKSLSGPKAE